MSKRVVTNRALLGLWSLTGAALAWNVFYKSGGGREWLEGTDSGQEQEQGRLGRWKKRAGLAGQVAADKRPRVVVVGGGTMGLSSAYALAKGGHCASVTLVDSSHPIRSSWGESRISRLAYSDPLYIRMMKRAFSLWDEASRDMGGVELLHPCPTLDIGEPASLDGLRAAYRACGVSWEELSPADVKQRFPQVHLGRGEAGVLNRDAAVVRADTWLSACAERCASLGVEVRSGESVVAVDREKRVVSVCVSPSSGGEVDADEGVTTVSLPYDHLVLCAGPWTNKVISSASPRLEMFPLAVSNEQQLYLRPKEGAGSKGGGEGGGAPASLSGTEWNWNDMPIVLAHGRKSGSKRVGPYVMPYVEGGVEGVKVSYHREGPLLSTEDFVLKPGSEERLLASCPNRQRVVLSGEGEGERRAFVAVQEEGIDKRMAKLTKDFVDSNLPRLAIDGPEDVELCCRCLYTSPPDDAFVVGRHPGDENITVATGFFGEGFKFSPLIGEMVEQSVRGVGFSVAGCGERFSPSRPALGMKTKTKATTE